MEGSGTSQGWQIMHFSLKCLLSGCAVWEEMLLIYITAIALSECPLLYKYMRSYHPCSEEFTVCKTEGCWLPWTVSSVLCTPAGTHIHGHKTIPAFLNKCYHLDNEIKTESISSQDGNKDRNGKMFQVQKKENDDHNSLSRSLSKRKQ